MEKGAWDGRACSVMAFALNFMLGTFIFQVKESDKSKINISSR